MNKVIWKDVVGFEALYSVSNTGKVINRHGRELCVTYKGKGNKKYPAVSLFKGKNKSCTIHRLVAIAFIPNPDNLPQVNHKDGDKLNNNVSNLEWCDNTYNFEHAKSIGLNIPWNKGNRKREDKNCLNCKKSFNPRKDRIKYCSQKCHREHRYGIID